MNIASVRKELDTYLPLLSTKQQELVLAMVKSILHVDTNEQRISIEQYNAEIEFALSEVKKGKSISHKDVVKLHTPESTTLTSKLVISK